MRLVQRNTFAQRMAGFEARRNGATWAEAAKIADMSPSGFAQWYRRMTEDNLDRGVSRATYELKPGEMRCTRCGILCAEAEADDNGWCPLCQEEAETGRMLGPSDFEAMCEMMGDRR